MFNLTVSEAHTFYVGQDGWLVHNCGEALANTANSALGQLRKVLPDNMMNVTVAVAKDASGKPILAVYGRTPEMTEAAYQALKAKGWNVVPLPSARGTAYHAERQLDRLGYTDIGISRQDGVCPACKAYFDAKPGSTVTEYKPKK